MDPTLGFTEDSRNAAAVSFCYGKLRQAELRDAIWTFAARWAALRALDTGTMLLAPAMWVAQTTYFGGSIVADAAGALWISNIPNNLNNQPESSLTWEPYFGPLSVSLYAAGQSYYAGEIVYTAAGDGTSRVFVSLQNSNTDNPATATAYDATAAYSKNQVVTYLSVAYMSLIDLNIGNIPTSTPAAWDIGITYGLSNTVTGSDNVIYSSLGGGNTGFDPTTDAGAHWLAIGLAPWTSTFVAGRGSDKWRQIGGAEFPNGVALTTIDIIYPLGAGPSSQSSSRNIYKLPNGFLRIAPQNPKSGITPWLGGPTGKGYSDWILEGGYLITGDTGVIPLRFVADVTDVRRMDPMFCEGLAARVGMEVCEELTQSTAKIGTIAKVYAEWISRAETANAIEQSFEDPPDDEYILVRN